MQGVYDSPQVPIKTILTGMIVDSRRFLIHKMPILDGARLVREPE